MSVLIDANVLLRRAQPKHPSNVTAVQSVAKLLALDPSLTAAQVIELIKEGATTSEDGRRHLIDEKRSVALLKANTKK